MKFDERTGQVASGDVNIAIKPPGAVSTQQEVHVNRNIGIGGCEVPMKPVIIERAAESVINQVWSKLEYSLPIASFFNMSAFIGNKMGSD